MNLPKILLLVVLLCVPVVVWQLACHHDQPPQTASVPANQPAGQSPPKPKSGYERWPEWNRQPNTPTSRARPANYLRVLFVGNSLTWFNGGQAAIVEQLAQSANERRPALCEELTIDGATLDWHCLDGSAEEMIDQANWDVVVLQDHSSTGPIYFVDKMHAAARELDSHIRKAGASTVFFLTWGTTYGAWERDSTGNYTVQMDQARMQAKLANAYGTIAKELGAKVAPVGWAWAAAVKEHPEIELYDDDGRHPAEAGSYLSGCVFYSLLYRKSPEGLTGKIICNGEKRIELTPEQALALQRIAWRTVSEASAFPSTGPASQPAPAASLTLNLDKGAKLDAVLIPAGEFTMGSPDGEADRDDCEGPQHKVTIAKPFYMGKFEVTQAQWKAVMNNNQSAVGGDDLPAECVAWSDVQKFCTYATKITGRTVRLPTEAEWEYACRAGSQKATAFGESMSSEQANFNGTAPYGDAPAGPKRWKTTPVGSFKPNAFGLYDMHGNVHEWVQDVYHDGYAGAPADGSAWMDGGSRPEVHVYRGGSWNNDGFVCRSANRYAAQHEMRNGTLGFRVVIETAGQ